MDKLTFITKLIDSLAWPAIALILGLKFREKLLDLISAIRVKAGPVEAEFELAAKQVLASTAEVTAAMSTPGVGANSATSTGEEIVTQLISARHDPVGLIMESWARIDAELFRLGSQIGIVDDPLENSFKVYQAVMASDIIPTETRRLVRELRDLRNQVAHAKVRPTAEAAQDYLLSVDRVVDLMHNYRKNLPRVSSNASNPIAKQPV